LAPRPLDGAPWDEELGEALFGAELLDKARQITP
jgi:hypothetical protein